MLSSRRCCRARNGSTGTSHPKYGPNRGAVDNQEDYTDCPDTLSFGAYDKKNVLPYTMNFTFNGSGQLAPTTWPSHSAIPAIADATPWSRFHSTKLRHRDASKLLINGEMVTHGFQAPNQNSFAPTYDYNSIAGEP